MFQHTQRLLQACLTPPQPKAISPGQQISHAGISKSPKNLRFLDKKDLGLSKFQIETIYE